MAYVPVHCDIVFGRGPYEMSFERVAVGTGIGAEPAPITRLGETAPTDGVSPAMRLQILSTEHWSLLASRSLAWNESFSRAGMFLTTLTGRSWRWPSWRRHRRSAKGSRSSLWSSSR